MLNITDQKLRGSIEQLSNLYLLSKRSFYELSCGRLSMSAPFCFVPFDIIYKGYKIATLSFC